MKLHFLSLLAQAVFLTGCASPELYSWGSYEDLIYLNYAKPGDVPPERQIELMEKDLAKASASSKPVHPGFHAHLGFLYAKIGRLDEAQRELETEKALFPESAQFMDTLLNNLKRK